MRTALSFLALATTALTLAGCSSAATLPVNTPMPSQSAAGAAEETAAPSATPSQESPTLGSREAPLALGESRALAQDSMWIVGISDADYDAYAAIRAEDTYAEAPPEGMRYVTATLSIAIAEENVASQGVDIANEGIEPWYSLITEYVGSDGKSYDETGTGSSYCYTDNDLAAQGPIYDASVVTVGNVCVVVPETAVSGGIWRISNTRNDAVWIEGGQ